MGTQEQPTEIGVEDLTSKLKEANFFRVRYFAKNTTTTLLDTE